MKNVTKFKATVKLVRAVFIIIRFMLDAFFVHLFASVFRFHDQKKLHFKQNLIERYSHAMLKNLDIKVHFRSPVTAPTHGLLICNHLSYVDILVLGSVAPSLFITSVETGQAGWIGYVCKLAGCMFVERRKEFRTESDFKDIDRCLELGVPVVLFPEATSTSGKGVLPFKSTLYQCAIRTLSPLHCFCLYYDDPNEIIPYHSDMTLPAHLANLCHFSELSAHLIFLETIHPTPESDRKQVALQTHSMISEAYVHRTC